MNKLTRQVILWASLALLALPAVVQAQFILSTNNEQITIMGYTGSGGVVSIPDTINGLPVTSIGDSAFFDCSRLTSVTISSSVTNIGFMAFSGCASLTNATIPNSVTRINAKAFGGCTSLISITIPSSVNRIGSNAFGGCTSLTGIVVNESNAVYSSVGGVLFDKNQTTLIQYPNGKAASSYAIPNGVTSIGFWAFSSCHSLTNVTIPNSVTSISGYAFEGFTSLISITIPSSVNRIGSNAFGGCTSLTAITVDTGNPVYSSLEGVLLNKKQTMLIQYPGGKVSDYTIPDSVTGIGFRAIFCDMLTSVTIPNSVTNMGRSLFFGGPCMTVITVKPNNPAYSSVDGVLFNKNQTTIIQCPRGKAGTYTIPDGVTSIGNQAFAFCTNLTSITVGNGVTNIGDEAFLYCTTLTRVYFRGDAPILGNSSFTDADHATCYHLLKTTGWTNTFSGRPTAIWKPGTNAPTAGGLP